MVEITYQMLLSTLQTIALIVGIAYYLFIMRNSIRTRQAGLFMELYGQFRAKDFQEMVQDIRQFEYTDMTDFYKKYGSEINPEAWVNFYSVMSFYEGVGVLIRRNLISPVLVDDMMSGPILQIWGKFGPMVLDTRERFSSPTAWEYTEYLYYEIKKIVERQHGLEFASRYETNW
jgi:hypothetical protein